MNRLGLNTMNDEGLISAVGGLSSLMPLVHGGAGDGGGGAVALIEALLEKINALIESGTAFALFPGIRALATNVHPMLVHFPIAFLSGYFVLDLFGVAFHRPNVRRTAGWMLYLGAAAALAAASAGLFAGASVPHGAAVHEVMEWHERIMLSVTGLAVFLAIWRAAVGGAFNSTMANGLSLFIGVVMVALMAIGADLGGLMVYRHGVGVASLQRQEDAIQHLHGGTAGPDDGAGATERVMRDAH